MMKRFEAVFRPESKYRAFFLSIITFGLAYGLYKGVIDNYLAEIVGMSGFDKGETFSGVPYELGLEAAEELKKIFGTDRLAPIAIRWVLMHPQVSVVIPGASRAAQVLDNVQASELPPLTEEQMQAVRRIYDQYLRAIIHPQW